VWDSHETVSRNSCGHRLALGLLSPLGSRPLLHLNVDGLNLKASDAYARPGSARKSRESSQPASPSSPIVQPTEWRLSALSNRVSVTRRRGLATPDGTFRGTAPAEPLGSRRPLNACLDRITEDDELARWNEGFEVELSVLKLPVRMALRPSG